jgi:hypothetical protein
MAEVHSSAAGPGSAQTAEIIYGPAVEDTVLAAGIAGERFDPESLEAGYPPDVGGLGHCGGGRCHGFGEG